MANHPNRSLNIRNETDRAKIEAAGFTWVTVDTRGECKGAVRSKHRSYDAANAAAKDTDRTIVEVIYGSTF